jgi:hypothetical protein
MSSSTTHGPVVVKQDLDVIWLVKFRVLAFGYDVVECLGRRVPRSCLKLQRRSCVFT